MRNFVRVSCYIDAEENKGMIMPFLAERKRCASVLSGAREFAI
jgi:hypothetical protein